MGFEVAIYNNECDDGSKVIDSVKAAYLYADSVRVYDFLTPDFYILMESLIKEELMYKEWAEKNKRFIRQIFKSVGHGHVQIALFAEFFRKFTDDDFIMLSKFFDRLGSDKDLPDIEILFRKARAAESNRIKKNEEYSRSMYLMALRKMGVLLIQPDICGTSSFVRHQLENFSDRFIEDVGFKLFNSNPEGLSNQVNLPAIITLTS